MEDISRALIERIMGTSHAFRAEEIYSDSINEEAIQHVCTRFDRKLRDEVAGFPFRSAGHVTDDALFAFRENLRATMLTLRAIVCGHKPDDMGRFEAQRQVERVRRPDQDSRTYARVTYQAYLAYERLWGPRMTAVLNKSELVTLLTVFHRNLDDVNLKDPFLRLAEDFIHHLARHQRTTITRLLAQAEEGQSSLVQPEPGTTNSIFEYQDTASLRVFEKPSDLRVIVLLGQLGNFIRKSYKPLIGALSVTSFADQHGKAIDNAVMFVDNHPRSHTYWPWMKM